MAKNIIDRAASAILPAVRNVRKRVNKAAAGVKETTVVTSDQIGEVKKNLGKLVKDFEKLAAKLGEDGKAVVASATTRPTRKPARKATKTRAAARTGKVKPASRKPARKAAAKRRK